MLQRKIPSTGELMPVIGTGSWIQFDVENADEERQPLAGVLQAMHELGSTLLDTSPMYGKAEAVIGDLTQATGMADAFFYATKVWTTGQQAGIRQLEDSFRKLKRPILDLVQVHNLTDWKTHLQTLKAWKAEERIRYVGVTHYTASAHEELERIVRTEELDFVQLNYSIRERNAEKRLLPAAHDHGVAVIVNEPFEKGSLFKAVKGKALPEWAAEYDVTSWEQFFLKYILSHPAVNCVIPGTSDPVHAIGNLAAGYGQMPDESGRKRMADWMNSL